MTVTKRFSVPAISIVAITSSFTILPIAWATHDSGCTIGEADPATYLIIDTLVDLDGDGLPEVIYQEERDTGLPPVPMNGFISGSSSWTYEENRAYFPDADGSLQRGGVGLLGTWFPPGAGPEDAIIHGEDPITDEVCGHDAFTDDIIWGGKVNPRAVPQGTFQRLGPDAPIQSVGFPGCDVSIGAESASVFCFPSENGLCLSPGLVATASAGTVSGATWCLNSPVASASATGPAGWDHDIVNGVFAFPWFCQAEFPAGAIGQLTCDAPDP